MLVDGQCVRRRLLGRRHVSLLSAEGPWPAHRLCRFAGHVAEPDVLPVSDALGLVRRPLWPADNANDYLAGDHPDRATVPADHRLHDDRGILHPAGLLWRRHAHAVAPLRAAAMTVLLD